MENLYGIGIEAETEIVGLALRTVSTRETAHPQDRLLWSADNPTYGQCDLFTDISKQIWGRNVNGVLPRWNRESKVLVWWAYPSVEAYEAGKRKNKLTVHYSFYHPGYGEIDLARDQFPDNTYLVARPRPLRHIVEVTRSWDKSSEMGRRRDLIEPKFVDALLYLLLPDTITPELEFYINELRRRGKR